MEISKGTRWFAKGSLMLLAIFWGSSYLINRATTPTPPKLQDFASRDPKADAKFKSFFDAGNRAFHDGQYSDAIGNFLEAAQSKPLLTEDEYQSLKTPRLQIAKIYEDSGDTAESSMVYRQLLSCAVRDGQALLQAKFFYPAVARAQDAEQFSDHPINGQQNALQESRILLANALVGLKRYDEAEAAQQRMIDYLKANTDDDKAVADNYINLASIYSQASDWHGFEQALDQAIESCDRTLARYSADDNRVLIASTRISKNWAEYNLVVAYEKQGNTDAALSKADDFFNETLHPPDRTHLVNVRYSSSEIAALALQIATEAHRQDAIDLWNQRTYNK